MFLPILYVIWPLRRGMAQHLKSYGLLAPLRLAAAFRPLSARTEMQLSANALRQLEVLTAGVYNNSH